MHNVFAGTSMRIQSSAPLMRNASLGIVADCLGAYRQRYERITRADMAAVFGRWRSDQSIDFAELAKF